MNNEDTAVLRTLLVKGRADVAAIAEAAGLETAVTQEVLEANQTKDFVKLRTGRGAGWLLTPAGRAHATELVAAERAEVDTDTALELYEEEFLPLNARFKTLCAEAQNGVDVTVDLAEIHSLNLGLLKRLAEPVPRLDRYTPRFGAAHDRFAGGDASALLRPLSDSYHDVWMELHEDLLVLLGQTRHEDD
jgi:hypothetical protein